MIDANKFIDQISKLQLHLYDEMLVAQAIYKSWANIRRRLCPCYFVDNKVWLNTRNIWTTRPIVKLDDQNIASYQVA